MFIDKLEVYNFKSFKHLEASFDKFNVIIGANASGKSNLIEIFKFLRDILNHGLSNAISIQGGVKYLRNIKIGPKEEFNLKISFDPGIRYIPLISKKIGIDIGTSIKKILYEFTLQFNEIGSGYHITKDMVHFKFNYVKLLNHKYITNKIDKKIGEGEIKINSDKKGINYKIDNYKIEESYKDYIISEDAMMMVPFPEGYKIYPNLLIEKPPFSLFAMMGFDVLRKIKIYDFDPKLPKKAAPITGKEELEENCSNLAIVLNNITRNKKKERTFLNLLKNMLPFVEKYSVQKYVDRSMLINIKEIYEKKHFLPAFSISDGTINIVALIISLYFEKEPFMIFEEPDRNIHPYLISKIISMFEDASKRKQIIITTHNPEIVKYAPLKNILLISRSKKGFSSLSKPIEKEEMKIFLENDLGVDDLFIKNLLKD